MLLFYDAMSNRFVVVAYRMENRQDEEVYFLKAKKISGELFIIIH